jgi:hypothetical protein
VKGRRRGCMKIYIYIGKIMDCNELSGRAYG